LYLERLIGILPGISDVGKLASKAGDIAKAVEGASDATKAAAAGRDLAKAQKAADQADQGADLLEDIAPASPEALSARQKADEATEAVQAADEAPKATNATGDSLAPKIEEGKQGKHIPDHNNFIPGKSEFTHPAPQQLVDNFAGTGQPANNVPRGQPGFKERVDFGQIIGNYVDPATGEKLPTTKGIIHYSKSGVHIVPARP
jgi:hypothetical protein